MQIYTGINNEVKVWWSNRTGVMVELSTSSSDDCFYPITEKQAIQITEELKETGSPQEVDTIVSRHRFVKRKRY